MQHSRDFYGISFDSVDHDKRKWRQDQFARVIKPTRPAPIGKRFERGDRIVQGMRHAIGG